MLICRHYYPLENTRTLYQYTNIFTLLVLLCSFTLVLFGGTPWNRAGTPADPIRTPDAYFVFVCIYIYI